MIIILNFRKILSKIFTTILTKTKEQRSFTDKYTFENRSQDSENLCIILAGYKEFTWENIFNRINEFSEENIDFCIVSSGLYSEKLSKIAEKYDWSYISTKKNSVTQTQNTAIKLFPNAKFIYKLDEDIFITKDFFKTLKNTYLYVQEEGEYDVGFVAPLIPINGYAHATVLEKLDLTDYYENKFEKIKRSAENEKMIVSNPEVAKFMWGENDKVPHIDELNKMMQNSTIYYSAATIRFSIGAILYTKDLWEDMGYFKVRFGTGLGLDETQICSYCVSKSKAMIISENSCVGHLSFQLQNEEMKKYYLNHPQRFEIKEI